MALSKLTKDLAIIQKLDDEPNDVGGLTAAELKAKFDEAGLAIQKYLNETLLGELGGDAAAASLGAVLNDEKVSVQGALDLLQRASIQSGNVPMGGSAGEFLRKKSDELYDLEWASGFTVFSFGEADWTQGEDGVYAITIPRSAHCRQSANFGCTMRHNVDGVLQSNTWAALGTQTVYDESTGDITLRTAAPYDGAALFYG